MNYDGSITIKTQLDNSGFDKEIAYIESQMKEIENKLSQADMGFDVGDTQKLEAQYEKLSKKLGTLITKQRELNKTDFSNIENSIKNVGTATNNVIGKIGKWALAIFSVRTAYGAISNAMSTLSQHDENLKADLEFIKYSVAVALKPVIEFIVNLAYKLLGIVRAIGLTLFNFDIFSEATAENFKKIQGNASKIKKTLAGFDEMNVLNSASSGGGGGIIPSGKIEIDETAVGKIEKIKKAYKEMQTALNDPEQFRGAFGAWGTFVEGVTRIFYGLLRTIDGVMTVIAGIVTGDTEKIKDGVIKIVEGLLNIVLGILQTLVGLVQGIIYKIGTAIYSILSTIGAEYGKFIANIITNVINMAKKVTDTVKKYIIDPIVRHFENMWTSLKKSGIKGLINYFIECWENAINWIGKNFTKMLNKISFTNPITGEKVGVDITYKNVKLPRLAKGTILNNPGQGVLVGGSAIAGEAGREAYLPLSDTQLLEELGSTIGKYITINANITNSMNGRIISRELKRINANDNFAMNSR